MNGTGFIMSTQKEVDLIKWVSNVSLSIKSFFDFSEIWYVDRGR